MDASSMKSDLILNNRATPPQFRAFILSFFLLFVSACTTTYPVNPPLTKIEHDGDSYTIQNSRRDIGNRNEALVLLAFSGGGTRAAAFSYGVLEELSETSIGDADNSNYISDEIDVITAVSGGSFTAAYFGLYGDRIFEDYEQKFLRRNVQEYGDNAPPNQSGEECQGVAFHFVEVNFSSHPDPEEQDYLKQLPTSFVLNDEAVDRLIAAGRLVLRSNEEYQQLLAGAN